MYLCLKELAKEEKEMISTNLGKISDLKVVVIQGLMNETPVSCKIIVKKHLKKSVYILKTNPNLL